MKVAFVHDRLVYPGGAEKVFFDMIQELTEKKEKYYFKDEIIKKFNLQNISEIKIFTTFYNKNYKTPVNYPIEGVISHKKLIKYYRHLFPIFPILQKKLSLKLKKYNPDLVIISSFAIAKNIDINKPKILYLHSSMQYIWSHYDEYTKKFKFPTKQIFQISAKYLRIWDKKYTGFDYIIFNSNYTKKIFSKIYKTKPIGEVIHPKVDIPNFKDIDIFEKYNLHKEYYIYIGRLVKLVKHLDKIIKAFNKNGKQLVIVGDGPDKEYLQKLANKNIKFLGYIDSKKDEYRSLLKNAKGLINLTKESFGIVNKQASLIGTPIICKNHGAINDIPGKKIFLENEEDLEKI